MNMTKFEDWILKKLPRIGCALYSFKHSKDRDYYNKAIQIDSMVMRCKNFGNENPDKNIYFIDMGDRNNGFFAEYHKLLKFLYYADRFHMTPVVRFNSNFIYSEDHEVNGSDNPFEYFFEQPGNVSVTSAYRSRNVFIAEYVHTQIKDLISLKKNDYETTDEYINLMGVISNKYLKLNESVENIINTYIDGCGISEKTIGVHYRGTDYKRGLTNHPKLISLERYLEAVKEMENKGEYDKVFIASDSVECIEYFKRHFPGDIIYFEDSLRSDGNISVAFSKADRKDHHYTLGLEVLRDMVALSRCGVLVSGLSQVSLAARITKAASGNNYREYRNLSCGLNETNMDGRKYYEQYGN